MPTWRFGDKLGSGGYGQVRLATNEETGEGFAAKFLALEAQSNPEAVARFRREVRIQSGLVHANIVRVVDADLDASSPYFVMEKADRSLDDAIIAGLPEPEIERIFLLVLEAMAYAHANGVIHRDMKPLNVLLFGSEPRVSDFGLGKTLTSDSSTITRTTSFVGTFVYMAPEQLVDPKNADERSDIYALGRTLQQMLTAAIPIAQLMPKVPRKYRYLIERCCEQEPDDRYQSVESLRDAFDQVVRGIERPKVPYEEADRLIAQWQNELLGDDLPILRELHAVFEQNVEDGEFFQGRFPALPDPLLRDYLTRLPRDFERMLRSYDEHVSGGLDFDYCDVVANFYEKVWQLTEDSALRRLMLARLIVMGSGHNRFYVGDVVGRLVGSVEDQGDAMMVADVLRAEPRAAAWFDDYISRERLPAVIAKALTDVTREPDDVPAPLDPDIPF